MIGRESSAAIEVGKGAIPAAPLGFGAGSAVRE
jgi:hypothetical protein